MKNKVAAARLAKPANPWFANPWSAKPWSAAWPWAARIRNPVLLKTASRTRQADDASPGYYSLGQYSRGARPMQRGHRTSNRLAVDSVTAYARAERVRAPESCSRRSFGDSNAHSEPFAATKAEAHIFQRNREGGSGMLPVPPHPRQWNSSKNRLQEGWQRRVTKYLLERTILTLVKTQSYGNNKAQVFACIRSISVQRAAALVKLPFGMLRCAVAATVNRQ